MSDIKLYALNATSLALSFSQLDMVLKILLLVISVGLAILCPLEAFSSAIWLNGIGLAVLLGFFVLQKMRRTG